MLKIKPLFLTAAFKSTRKTQEVKTIRNVKKNHHLNSKHWQDYKKSLPLLCKVAFEIAIGMILGDASIYKVSREAHIKFEQGYKQKEFIEHLFSAFSLYCFILFYGQT